MVTCKFRCNAVIDLGNAGTTVMFNAVYGDGAENKDWSKFTPSGSIGMQISKDSHAAKEFGIGDEFIVTFESVGR